MRGFWIRSVLWLAALQRRLLAALVGMVGPEISYRLTGWSARLLYHLLDPFRLRCEAQCRAALAGRVPDRELVDIARASFVHRVWNLTDLTLAARLLRPSTYRRLGGRIPEPYLSSVQEAQQNGQAVIFLTAYYGSFDLLPIFLGYNGVPATVVYLPHGNVDFDNYRRRVRSQSGCELVPVEQAARLGEVLGRGGAIGLVADHHIENRGMTATFFGIETNALRSVGLLAWRYEADVIVAGIRRVGRHFRFELVIADIIDHRETAARPDSVAFVTERYLRALERMILKDPTQYRWGYARWGEDHARRATARYAAAPANSVAGVSTAPGGVADRQAEVDG